jgi:hypothetical protein
MRAKGTMLLLVLFGFAPIAWAKQPKPGKPVRVTNLPVTQDVRVTNPPATQDVQVTNLPPAPLAPTTPSQLVTIRSSKAVKCGTSPWLALDTQVNQDGTLSPFSIPAGMVLVVTSVDWRQGNTGAPGKQEEFFLFPSADHIDVNFPIVDSLSLGSADSRAGTSLVVTGVAIKSGTPCWGVNSPNIGSADVLVHGFLTEDR